MLFAYNEQLAYSDIVKYNYNFDNIIFNCECCPITFSQ